MPRQKCTITDCNNPQVGKGYCGKHYARWKKHGDPSIVKYNTTKSARVAEYLETGVASCHHHGEHGEWGLSNSKDVNGSVYKCLRCNICTRERSAKWRNQNPEKHKSSMGTLSVTASRLLSGAKIRALRAGIEINITRDWIISKFNTQSGRCALSNRPFQLEYTSGGRRENALSLDQINPGAGYTTDNTQLVIWSVNEMKKRQTLEGFLDLCCDIAQHRGEKG